MYLQIKNILLILCILGLSVRSVFSQDQKSKDNYTGNWENPSSWDPDWAMPLTDIIGSNFDIEGYITANGSLSFTENKKLTVKDTLVIKGDLTLINNYDIKVENDGILIVWGSLTISYDSKLDADGYVIVTGDIIKEGDISKGNFTSNDDPVLTFVGGTVPSGLTDDNSKYKPFNCTAPNTIPYPNSTCSYGNMIDIIDDPIYTFFQSTCTLPTPTITVDGPTTFCDGGSVTLSSSLGTSYLWSNGTTTQDINVTLSGSYTVQISNENGCQSSASTPIVVTINEIPITPTISVGGPTTFCNGESVSLSSSTGFTYLWSNGETTQNINATLSESYSVQVTNADGCQSTSSAPILVTVNDLPAAPIITAGGPTTFCNGGSVNLSSSLGTSYLWSNGETTQNINATVSDSYSVQVTNANGCESASSTPIAVTVNEIPTTPAITSGGPTTFCDGGSVTLSASPEASYLWSNGATTQDINITSSGSYTVQVSNESGCQSAVSIATIVTVNALPTQPVISPSSPTTFCNDESVTLSSSTGTGYLWSNGETSQDINVTSSGSYTVQTTNENGCQSAISETTGITVNELPTVNAGTDITIPNGTSTSIDATVTGDSPFLYSWSPAGQLVNATIEDPTTVNLSTTTIFTLTATSIATSCSNNSAMQVSISGGPLSASPTATPGTICAGENVQLEALATGGSGSYTYSWTSVPAGFTSSIPNPIVNPTVSTTYHVEVFDGFNTDNSQIGVVVNALPAVPSITAGGPTTFCSGGSVTLSSSAGTSYLWSSGETSQNINITASGNYSVQVTNASGCQSATSTSTAVVVNPLPSSPTITAGGPTAFCIGNSVTLSSSAGVSYLWSNGATTQNINITAPGNYTVQVSNVNGCQSAVSVETVVTVHALPAVPTVTAGGPTSFCSGGNVSLSSSVGSSYLWSNGATLQNIIVNSSDNYTVQVSDANGCQSAASIGIIVTVNALPTAPSITAGGPTTFCSGGSVNLSSSPGTIYLWSNGETTPDINVNLSASYSVQITDANGCQSSASDATTVTVNTLPFTPIITVAGPTTFCEGGSVSLSSSAGSSYLWSNGETTQGININSSGSYSVKVSNVHGCQSAASMGTTVTVNALPATPSITASGPTTFCDGGSVTLNSSPGSTYLWSNGATTPSINVSLSGSYSVLATDANGCESAETEATTVVNSIVLMPTITADCPTSFCNGESLTLSSSPGSSYLWSNGETTQNVMVNSSGNYAVQVTNADGCLSETSDSTSTTVNDLPIVNISSSNSSICVNNSRNLSGSPNGGTFSISSGPGSISGDILTASDAGEITVVYKYSDICANSDTLNIIVVENPIANAGPDQELKFKFEATMDAVLSLTETGEWSLISGSGQIGDIFSPTTSVSGLSMGENVFLWKVSNGNCEASAEITITVNNIPVPSAITPNGDGKNDYFLIGEIIGNAELLIINRWGNEVYSNMNYSNDWNGKNNNNEDLPNDTYFYILKFDNGEVVKGSLLIKR